LALEELHALTPQAKNAVEAYTRGVNAYLRDNGDKLPAEFTLLGYKPDEWRDVDSLAVMKYLAYELDESWKLDELRWRVLNRVGDSLASRLFNDDLSVSSWSPEPKVSSVPQTTPQAAPQKVVPGRQLGSPQGHLPSDFVGERIPVASGHGLLTAAAEQEPAGSRRSRGVRGLNTIALKDPDGRIGTRLGAIANAQDFMRKTDPSWGSTTWVLSPSYSKSGGALLAADKHSALTTPNEFFLCSISSPGMHVVGATIPGVPGIILGRNAMIGWSSAGMHADVQDLFAEHFASESDNKYKSPDKTENAKDFHEAIPVRFGHDVDHKISMTRHGPVLLRDKESAITLSWTGFQTTRPWLNALCAINTASDWNAFSQALSQYGGPAQLFVFADKRGNIGCHAAGIIPVRAAGADGTMMAEGWSGKGDWIAYVDYNDLPQSFMPAGTVGRPSGDFCIAAGQKLAAAPQLGARPAQVWGHQWAPPYRANRLALSLPRGKSAQKLDLFDFTAYQGDELSMTAQLVLAELKKAIEANKSIDAVQAKEMEIMQHWDLNVKRDSVAGTFYEAFIGSLARRIIESKLKDHELTNDYFRYWPLWTTFVEDYLRKKPADLLPGPDERTPETFLLTTFAKSNTRLKLLFKNDKADAWKWENAHIANFKAFGLQQVAWMRYLFDINGIGVGGDANCLNACDVDRTSVGGAYQCNNGPSVRLLMDMHDDDAIYGNLALGQSGHYFSPNRQDQLNSWLKADPLPIAFSDAQLEKQCRQKFYLTLPNYNR
jgi:penicillin amidase